MFDSSRNRRTAIRSRVLHGKGRAAWMLSLLVLALLLPALLPMTASAHPLGNFSVNRYAQIDIQAAGNDLLHIDLLYIDLLYIVDMAEIPTLQERSQAGIEGISGPAVDAYKAEQTAQLVDNLVLMIDGKRVPLRLEATELAFPAGQADLLTQRLTLHLTTGAAEIAPAGTLTFEDRNYPDRLGWKEIVIRPQAGVTLDESNVPAAGISDGLRSYPADFMQTPLRVEQATARFTAAAAQSATTTGQVSTAVVTGPATDPVTNGDPFAALIAIPALSPMAILLALLAALGWGAVHAMSPGHGKTIVGAYLVGSRGTTRHALFLGLTTTITHTAGVFALGFVTLFAANYILPETLFPWLSLLSGLSVVIIGLYMARSHMRTRLQGNGASGHGDDHQHTHAHGH
ncbi:MAG: hypothetical protein KDD78_20855, partial [Caldilineaceae bacterium]|nr:hypothetical protein [Caldilineaceae bacterium]